MKYITSKDIIGVYTLEDSNQPQSEFVSSISSTVDSDQATEQHVVLSSNPSMTEKENGQLAQEFREWKTSVTNVEYSATIKIRAKDLRRQRFNALSQRIGQLAQSGRTHDEELLFAALQNGSTTPIWTGSNLFDTTHQFGNSPVQSNQLTLSLATAFPAIPATERGTFTNPSDLVMLDSIFTSIQTILGQQSDEGKPLNANARNFMVAVPIGFTKSTTQAVTKDFMKTGESNGLRSSGFTLSFVPSPYLTSTDRFYVWADTPVKPFVIQREESDMISVLGQGSDYYFTHDAMLVKIENEKKVVPINFSAITQVILTA